MRHLHCVGSTPENRHPRSCASPRIKYLVLIFPLLGLGVHPETLHVLQPRAGRDPNRFPFESCQTGMYDLPLSAIVSFLLFPAKTNEYMSI